MKKLLATASILALAAAPAFAQGSSTTTSPTNPPATMSPATPLPAGSTAHNTATAPGQPSAMAPATSTADNTATAGASAQPDHDFVQKAAMGNMAEVQAGHLAEQRGATPAVREFGRWMVTDHTMAENMLQPVADAQHVDLPTQVDPASKDMMTKLQGLHGAAFDRAYINGMVQDHTQDVADFQKEAQSGSDAQVKDYASKVLPVIQAHLDEAKDLQGTIGSMASASGTAHRTGAIASGDTASGDRAVARLNQEQLERHH